MKNQTWYIFKKYQGEWSLYTSISANSSSEAIWKVYNNAQRYFAGCHLRAFRNNKLPWSELENCSWLQFSGNPFGKGIE